MQTCELYTGTTDKWMDRTNLALHTNELMHLERSMPSQSADEPEQILPHPIAQSKYNISES